MNTGIFTALRRKHPQSRHEDHVSQRRDVRRGAGGGKRAGVRQERKLRERLVHHLLTS